MKNPQMTGLTANPDRRSLLRQSAGLLAWATSPWPLALISSAHAQSTAPAEARLPSPEAVKLALAEAHRTASTVTAGKNADYIPYLAKVPSQLFGIAAMSMDGTMQEVGDSQYGFAIESISKVFTLALALEQNGADTILQKIGADPTGEAFNSVMALELHHDRPLNPFVNAGAMATVSLIQAKDAAERWNKIIGIYNDFAGRELTVNDDVYKSESVTNQHNRAIAWLLDNVNGMYSNPTEAVDIYTRQCSVSVTASDLAAMGATLANNGVHPKTKKRIISAANCAKVLAEMTLNGLYDSTGDWFYRTGLPAKSGVGGGILAIAPGRLSVAAFSPPLDEHGNSVRAQVAIGEIGQKLGLSILQ
jgi:glutaminase